jgi:hypothetical protein
MLPRLFETMEVVGYTAAELIDAWERRQSERSLGMKKYTNKLLLGMWGVGLAVMIVTMVVIRFRLDRVIELTI